MITRIISQTLVAFERGMKVMQLNTRLLLVGVLVFVFPLVFLLMSQSLFDTAQKNINTSEKQRISSLHDSISSVTALIQPGSDGVRDLLLTYAQNNTDITLINVVKETPGGYLIEQSADLDTVGTFDENTALYQNALGDPNQSLIFEYSANGVRYWQAVRKFSINSQTYYVVSDHSFKNLDSVMTARRQESYLGLTFIFAFLLVLAYWLARQIHWQARHKKLEAILEERNLFTNMIAHEFRAPLTAINGYSSFLAEAKNLGKKQSGYVENIQTSTSRLLDLVNDFLEVARIQSGKMNLQYQTVDVGEVTKNVVGALQPMAIEKNLTLTLQDSSVPLHLDTDPQRLTQVLTNIINNSLKYTDKGSVTVSIEKNPVNLTIRIKDTGMGISSDDQKKLFSPFMRVGGVEKTTVTGSGLGMWITKQLVDLLGGSIGVESIKGVGTHVVLTFKVKRIAT